MGSYSCSEIIVRDLMDENRRNGVEGVTNAVEVEVDVTSSLKARQSPDHKS